MDFLLCLKQNVLHRIGMLFYIQTGPYGLRAIPAPPYPITSPLPTFYFVGYYLLFLLSPFLIASSIFLLFHPFPFYQNSPTPFPGRTL